MERLFDVFRREGHDLFLVGGAVRDLAMGAEYKDLDDLDFTTDARPQVTLGLLKRAKFSTYDVGIEFGTVGAVLKGPRDQGFPKDVQITTYRSKEKYRRGSRHPTVSFGDSIDEDLWRRDFSINSIAMDGSGNYYDPYDGLGDIKRGVLRAVGDPMERLAEDPLRILRIARFMAKLSFEPDPTLEAAAYDKATWLLEIARQRWLQEMSKLLCGPGAPEALDFLARTRALGVILPELMSIVDLNQRSPSGPVHADHWALTRDRVKLAGKDKVLSWAALLLDIGRPWTRQLHPPSPDRHTRADLAGPSLAGLSANAYPKEAASGVSATFHHCDTMAGLMAKGIGRRFHFDTATNDAVSFVLMHHRQALDYKDDWSDPDVRRFVLDMKGMHGEVLAFARVLQRQPGDEAGRADLDAFEARIRALEASNRLHPVLPKGLGQALMKTLGLRPGPRLGDAIDWLKEEMIEDHLGFGLDVEAYVRYAESRREPQS